MWIGYLVGLVMLVVFWLCFWLWVEGFEDVMDCILVVGL